MSSSSTAGNTPLLRKLLIGFIFVITNILLLNRSIGNQDSIIIGALPTIESFQSYLEDSTLTSGVGLVTKDGTWGEITNDNKYKNQDIKILGFTDKFYTPVAKKWYTRLSLLGYTEHYVVAHDEESYQALRWDNMRVLPCFIKNPDYANRVKGLWKQIMSARLHFTMEQLKNGTHLLITDVDNVFSRHVPLYGFLEEGYDVYHAFEMRYPDHIYREFGFVICSGHQFLRSSPATIRFFDMIMNKCSGAKCDDQVEYNNVFFHELKIDWDNMNGTTPDKRIGALRVNTTHPENANLLVESVTGRSSVTNHTIKIWDRDFAWRLAGCSKEENGAIPEYCPSLNNWVGMPTKCEALTGGGTKVYTKLAQFEVWDEHCRMGQLLT